MVFFLCQGWFVVVSVSTPTTTSNMGQARTAKNTPPRMSSDHTVQRMVSNVTATPTT